MDNKLMNGSHAEIREMAARICRDYLHGSWRQVTGKDIGLSRVTGGLSNWLYHVSLPASLPATSSEPTQVLLRLYGQMHGERALEGLITESVIFTLLSERKLGPTLHGIFPGGRIEQYMNARALRTHELRIPRLSQLIGQKMAAIHAMDVPIAKEPVWLWDTMARWLQTALENLNSPGRVAPEDQAAVARLQTYDLQAEVDWMRQQITDGSYPVVFCHNDLQEGNILLSLDDSKTEEQLLADPSLVLIDFEYCSYNYRGFDLANHFLEWTYNYTSETHPYFKSTRSDYPSTEQKLVFIRSYLSCCQPDNKTDEAWLLREVEVFTLVSHLLFGIWGVVNAKLSDIPFGYWDYGLDRLDSYMALKSQSQLSSTPVSQSQLNDNSTHQSQLNDNSKHQSQLSSIPVSQSQLNDNSKHQSQLNDDSTHQSQLNDNSKHQSQLSSTPVSQSQLNDNSKHQSQLSSIPNSQSQLNDNSKHQSQLSQDSKHQSQLSSIPNSQSQLNAQDDPTIR